jgi:hypothetical protein
VAASASPFPKTKLILIDGPYRLVEEASLSFLRKPMDGMDLEWVS